PKLQAQGHFTRALDAGADSFGATCGDNCDSLADQCTGADRCCGITACRAASARSGRLPFREAEENYLMLDLILRGANLPDGREGQDIAIADGRIAEVAPAIEAKAAREIEAGGRLVTPPFVDAHFHM